MAAQPAAAMHGSSIYDTDLNERRNEIERLYGRIKRFRRVFTRYATTEMFRAFVTVAFFADPPIV